MSDEGRGWDHRYAEGSHGSSQPDEFLLRAWKLHVQPRFPSPGTAVDVAGGLGRHALWVAERSWKVTLVDASEVALAKARDEAEKRGLSLNLVLSDLEQYEFGRERFDVVLVFSYLERSLFPALAEALCPAGILIYKTYTREQLKFGRGPKNPAFLLQPNELAQAFPALGVLHYQETISDKAVAEFIGQRTS